MKIKVLHNFQGSLNGFEIHAFEKGTILETDEPTAKSFIEAGFCEPVRKEKVSPKNVD